ncbi:hypothetical protein FNL55_15410 [Tardiphaga sp. vice352]|jgi:hypothetical protein|uniref:hypothetical protein n=1 Tax=unclassified Tardiphaga TaxID=2631404 RepID=UPI001164202A|nr:MULTISPECIES: hypothetical protein [unclassified Tardiphaga]QDM17220.1 hypothetical protein FNL53_15690 [Tardiphaga sp. vice278]QDM22203.1 hypothetical protein FIU28_14345 [Tardiphaga sp. vice154]QDM27456.1 hypothetical protein FNL56_16010 [Tardiphaga sp. vice304]QDM32583.1 hypothetical protein FNL55_15410 [Tardiphaga sp. vice352]
MLSIAAILTLAAGVFYAASTNTTGWAMQVCRYGDFFCVNPSSLMIAAVLSLIWAFFLRVDRL